MGRITEPYESVYQPKDHMPLSKPNMSLTLTNRQLYNEAMADLFSKVTFSFRHHGQVIRFLNQISRASFNALESIELKFDHETCLDFFGAAVRKRRPHNIEVRGSTAWHYLMDSSLGDPLKLRHIRICFPHPRQRRTCRDLRNVCQRNFCTWALTAMWRFLRVIKHVELEGCIKDDQKAYWMEVFRLHKDIHLILVYVTNQPSLMQFMQ